MTPHQIHEAIKRRDESDEPLRETRGPLMSAAAAVIGYALVLDLVSVGAGRLANDGLRNHRLRPRVASLGRERSEETPMRSLPKFACAMLMTAGLSGEALSAGADTEQGKTPAAPTAAGADNQPNKSPTAVVSHSATVIKNGSKEEEKGSGSGSPSQSLSATPGSETGANKP